MSVKNASPRGGPGVGPPFETALRPDSSHPGLVIAPKPPSRAETVGELLHSSYANLAAAESSEKRGLAKHDKLSWMIRAKLFKGLRSGSMRVGTLFVDVRDMPDDRCVYCGTVPPPKLHADHLIPKRRGGPESGDNLVWACRSCNSSKGGVDLLEWYASRNGFPPLILMRRYLKLAMLEAQSRGLMDARLTEMPSVAFSIEYVPFRYPAPGDPMPIQRRLPDAP